MGSHKKSHKHSFNLQGLSNLIILQVGNNQKLTPENIYAKDFVIEGFTAIFATGKRKTVFHGYIRFSRSHRG